MKRTLQLIYLYTGFFIFGLAMIAIFPLVGLAHVLLPENASEWVKLHCMKFWASSFYTFGIWFYHKGSRKAQDHWPEGPKIIVSNHNSLLDTPALYLMLRDFARPLAKMSLTKAPVFGHLCKWITLPVDRKSAESRKKAMADMNSYLSNGGSLLIFPEGKTNKSKELIQPFEPGAFKLSFDLGLPVIPVLVRNSRHCLAGTKPMILRPGIITTEAGPVFNPGNFNSYLDLQRAVFEWYKIKFWMN